MVACFFCTSRCSLASEVGHTVKTINQECLASDSMMYPVPTALPMVFLGRCFTVKMSRTIACFRKVLIILSLFVVTTPHRRCSKANMAWDLTLTIFGFWLAAQTERTLFSHVLLQVYRKPVSMFTTYPLPAEVPMFSAMKCLQPTRIAVERASGYHVYTQSHGRPLRAVALAVGRWSSSMVTNLFWRSATVGALSIFDGHVWFQDSHGQLCVWIKEHLWDSHAFSAVIGVPAGLMSAHLYGCIRKGLRGS